MPEYILLNCDHNKHSAWKINGPWPWCARCPVFIHAPPPFLRMDKVVATKVSLGSVFFFLFIYIRISPDEAWPNVSVYIYIIEYFDTGWWGSVKHLSSVCYWEWIAFSRTTRLRTKIFQIESLHYYTFQVPQNWRYLTTFLLPPSYHWYCRSDGFLLSPA